LRIGADVVQFSLWRETKRKVLFSWILIPVWMVLDFSFGLKIDKNAFQATLSVYIFVHVSHKCSSEKEYGSFSLSIKKKQAFGKTPKRVFGDRIQLNQNLK
jgi:hypothetical protein